MTLTLVSSRDDLDPAPKLHERGYYAVFRMGQENICPGCNRSQWLVGRLMAECAFCRTALPLDEPALTGKPDIIQRGRKAAQGRQAA